MVSNPPDQYSQLEQQIRTIASGIRTAWSKIGSFKVLDENLAPEGLKPIARSISWLIDQITVQNLRRYHDEIGFERIDDPPHGLTQYDCVIKLFGDTRSYYLNVKTSLTITGRGGRFDISKAPRLIKMYRQNPDLVLLVAIIKLDI
ncbi:hypothetical protein ES702_00282 [subsurface metagenome]